MSPSSNILSVNSAKTSTQVVNNIEVLSDSSEGQLSFADVLGRAPAGAGREQVHGGGEILPPGGIGLPELAGQLEQSGDEVPEQGLLSFEEIAAFSTEGELQTDADLAAELPGGDTPSQADLHSLSRDVQHAAQTTIGPATVVASTSQNSANALNNGDQARRADPGLLVRSAQRVGQTESPTAAGTREAAIEGLSIAEQDRLPATAGREFLSVEETLASLKRGTVGAGPGITAAGESGEVVLKVGAPGNSAASLGALLAAPQTQSASLSAPRPTAGLTTSIDVPVTDKAWGNAFNERVTWLSGQKVQNAEIRLSPAELGPIRVTVSVQDDAAQLTFSAHHALTREAIEQAMPRLREMLSENGLSLAESTVDDGQSSDVSSEEHAGGSERADGIDAAVADGDDEVTTPVRQLRSSALVDTFA